MMTSDKVPPGSKHCTFVLCQDTFKPIVQAAVENPDRHVSKSGNCEATVRQRIVQIRESVSPESDAVQATHMVHDPVNGTTEECRGKDTPFANFGCCLEEIGCRRPDPNASTSACVEVA